MSSGATQPSNRKQRGEGKPETFDFLGFTHICGTTRKTGRFIVKRQTIRKRLSAKLHALKAELRRRWHQPVADNSGSGCSSVVQGYFNYHAVPGNMDSLNSFRAQVIWRWYPRASAAEPAPPDDLGAVSAVWSIAGFPVPGSCIRIRTCASTPRIRGRSRMQQSCTYGSVRGAAGDRRPYRDASAAAFGGRCIRAGGVAPPSNIRYSRSSRLARGAPRPSSVPRATCTTGC